MSAMMNIDKLIYDALAGRRSVVLPGAGTLEVKRRGAKQLSETQIIPPQNVVVFSFDETEGIDSVVSLAVAKWGVDEEEAVALYGSWLEGARRYDGGMTIDGVGEVGDGGFVIAERLHVALNPTNEEIVTMETERKSTPIWAWVIIGLLAALLVLVVLWGWKSGMFGGGARQPAPVETVVVAMPDPAAAVTASPAGETPPDATAAEPQVAPAPEPVGPRFHVIAGAFAIESNADNFMDKLKRQHPELTTEKLVHPISGYNMVSIFQTPSRREANNKMNLYWDIDLYLWIYEQK